MDIHVLLQACANDPDTVLPKAFNFDPHMVDKGDKPEKSEKSKKSKKEE